MNRTLIAVFIVVLVISLLFAPGKAVAIGIAVPLAGVLICLLYKAFRRWAKAAENRMREEEAPALARKQRAIQRAEDKSRAAETILKDAEAENSTRQEARVKALAEASRNDRKRACLQYVAEHLLVDCLIIDTNIWMNDEYGCFFYVLEEACREKQGYKLILDAEQFDEICNLGKSTEYGAERSQRARLAVERIEQLQKKGLLTIPSARFDAKRVTCGDPLAVQLVDAAAKEGKTVALVSDDRDLRIKVRKYIYKSGRGKIGVVNIESIIKECREVQAADQSFAAVVSA